MTVTLDNQISKESHLVLSGISWTQFEIIEAAFSEIPGLRFIYLDGYLEIMTLSHEHEDTKKTIALLVEAYMREQRIRFYGRGSATLGSQGQGARKEPDESYNIETKKPIPDLVIEVVITSGGIDILELYKRLGVPEVWLWEDRILQVYSGQQEYKKVNQSQIFPELDLSLLAKYVTYYDQYDALIEFLQQLRKMKD